MGYTANRMKELNIKSTSSSGSYTKNRIVQMNQEQEKAALDSAKATKLKSILDKPFNAAETAQRQGITLPTKFDYTKQPPPKKNILQKIGGGIASGLNKYVGSQDAPTNPNQENAVVNVGGYKIGSNIIPIAKKDNPILKVVKNVGNTVLGAPLTAMNVLGLADEGVRQAAIQTNSLAHGKGLTPYKQTSVAQDILPKNWTNKLNQFKANHPILGGLSEMAINTVAPSSLIGIGGAGALKNTTKGLANIAETNIKILNKFKAKIPLTVAEVEHVKSTPELLQLPGMKQHLMLEAPKLKLPNVIEGMPPKPTPLQLSVLDKLTLQPKVQPTSMIGKLQAVNRPLEQAKAAYNDAIQTIQNHFGTNELRTSEMPKIKSELGIDLDSLIANIEKSQGRKLSSAEMLHYKRIAGINSDASTNLINNLNKKVPNVNKTNIVDAVNAKNDLYNTAKNNVSYNVPDQFKKETPFTVFKPSTPPKVEPQFAKGELGQAKLPLPNKDNINGLGSDLKGQGGVQGLPDTTQYIASKTTKEKSNIGVAVKKRYASTIDDLYAIKPVNQESYIKALNSRQVDMIAHRSLTTGLVDNAGKVVNESLKSITKDIPKGKFTQFTDYMVNLHAPTWMEQGRKVFPDSSGMTADMSRAKVANYLSTNPEFQQLGQRVTKYQQQLAKTWLVDSGFMKAETWDGLLKQYPDYIPFQREFTQLEKSGGIFAKKGFVNQTNPIKKGVGSQRKIIDPIETIIERTGQYIKTAKRNDVMNPIVDELQKSPNAYEGIISIVEPKSAGLSADAIIDVNKIIQEDGIDGLIEMFNKPWESQRFLANKGGSIAKGSNIVTVMRDGSPVHLKVEDMDFLKAVSNLNPQQATAITRTVGKVTGMMKTLTTGINPVFGLARNIWRDLVTGYVNSNTINANPLRYAQYMWDLTRAVGNTIAEPMGRMEFLPKAFQDLFAKGGEPMANFKNIGGGGHASSISSDVNLLKKAKDSIMAQSVGQKIRSIPKRIVGGIESLNNTLEAAPRLAEAKRVLKKGGTTDQALFSSQDLTVNFSKKGNVIKEGDAFVPYLNAAVQGLDKSIRVYNPASSGGKNVANSIAKSVYAITIPTIILYAINHADDAYNMLSDYQKDNFFNVPNGDGTFTKIPKPREQGVVFGALQERILRAFKEGNPEAFKRFTDTIKQNFMPPTSTIFNPYNETKLFNKDVPGYDWRGNPIENQSMQIVSPKNRYDENTSEPAKFIGNKTGLSPKKLDALAKSYLGGMASLGLSATTKGKNILDTLKQQVTSDPVYSNDIMNDFYKKLDVLQKKANDKDFESGIKGKADLRQKTNEERKVTEINKYKKKIDDINKKIKETSDLIVKRNLRLEMLSIAKEAIKVVK